MKSLVNLIPIQSKDMEVQAIILKKIFYRYRARCIAIDANGVGAGLVDELTKSQIDPDTSEELIPFGVAGGTFADAMEQYRKIRGVGVENDALYLIKATAPINTEGYGYLQSQMSSNKIHLLEDERDASARLMATKVGQNMLPEEKAEKLMPFQLTSILKEQLLNLVQQNDGVNIILKPNNNNIPKDKVSAFMYGLYYIKQEESKKNKKRGKDISDFMFFS